MMKLIGPRETVLVTSKAHVEHFGKRLEKEDILAVDWHMPCSLEPFTYAIAINKKHFSHKLILHGKAFIVNIIPKELEQQALFCGTHSGEHVDKFRETKLTKIESNHIDCVKIAEALGWIECEVMHAIDIHDHTLFIGKVRYFEMKREAKRLYHIKDNEFTTVFPSS
ncbi:flavin reductase family protein [Candidatus Woesearchaeota archaeon]|nr:flavin reductase family protein [Candidatus Woesearchaeota archaeon]